MAMVGAHWLSRRSCACACRKSNFGVLIRSATLIRLRSDLERRGSVTGEDVSVLAPLDPIW